MARDFDGTNDNLLSADNAVPGMDVDQRSAGYWVRYDINSSGVGFITMTQNGAGNARWTHLIAVSGADYLLAMTYQWSTAFGTWISATATTVGVWVHFAVTYDRALTTNDPVLYINGTAVTVNETVAPTGTLLTGDDTIKYGENAAGTGDMNGAIVAMAVEVGVLWDAAQVNRCRWWGRPHGGQLIYHPFWTPKLADEGSAAETLTASGTTVTDAAIPVVRPGSAMMGLGVGW